MTATTPPPIADDDAPGSLTADSGRPASDLPAPADHATRDEGGWVERHGRPFLVAVTVLSFVLNAWGVEANGLGNTYYAAAARSMASSWHDWFFNAFDPGGYISVDKPPVALWIQALSVRVFGFSSTSLMLPSAIAGAAAVALLWCTIRPRFGVIAATVSGAILALSPINVAINRLNLPDPFMALFLIAAAWAVMKSLDSRKGLAWVLLAGLFVGLAFNTKMLAAYIPVPAIGIGVLIGTAGSWWKRIGRGVAFGLSAVVCSLPWMVVVDLWDKSARPYIGGSTDNTVWDLVFGYNGFGHVDGNGQGGGGLGGGGLAGPGGVFGGSPGTFRLWNDAVGGQIAWLIPLGVSAAVAGMWLHRRHRARLAGVVMFAMWAVICGAVFSYAKGTFHSYYTSELAPGLAATIGIGGVALARLLKQSRTWLAVIAGALVVTVVVQLDLIGRTPEFFGWTEWPLLVVAVVATCLFVAAIVLRRGRSVLVASGLALALAATLLTPAGWAFSEASNATLNATLPQAGPRTGTAAGTFGGGQFVDSQNVDLGAFLREGNTGEHWDLVVSSAMQASNLIASQDLSVMALGGFLGSDPASTVDSIADLVAKGEVRYFMPTAGGPGAFGGPPGAGPGGFGGGRPSFTPNGNGTVTPPTSTATAPPNFNGTGNGMPPNFNGTGNGTPPNFNGAGGAGAVPNDNSAIMSAVRAACTALTTSTNPGLPSEYSGQIYDCQGKAAALRDSGGDQRAQPSSR